MSNPTATFFVRVAGDSMEGAGMYSNDVLTVDRSITPRSGHIVVAVVDGGLVVKELQKTATGFVLASATEGYEPILLNETEGCYIWGVVVGLVRKI